MKKDATVLPVPRIDPFREEDVELIVEASPAQFDIALATMTNKDLQAASKSLSGPEARYLVDYYYKTQRDRIRAQGQLRAAAADGEPNSLVSFLLERHMWTEKVVARSLGIYGASLPVGRWLQSQHGIGPVITAGYLSMIDIKRAPAAGNIWSFAGLNPTQKWGKGERRPWNARLKTLCVIPGQRVTTRRGFIPIEEVKVGDDVLTHNGRWKAVTQVFVNEHQGAGGVYEFHAEDTARGDRHTTLKVTAEHPLYARFKITRTRPSIEDADIQEIRRLYEEEAMSLRDIGYLFELPISYIKSVISRVIRTSPIEGSFGWHRAADVNCGWELATPIEGGGIRHLSVVKIEPLPYSGPVYNLEVEDDHSYVVEGVCVHNCWKTGQSFMKFNANENCFYGHVYKARKILEVERNEEGLFAEQAKLMLETKNFREETNAKAHYSKGMLPPGHLDARARRYAVKLFLSHLHTVWWWLEMGQLPAAPYTIAHMQHVHYIFPPGLDSSDLKGLREALEWRYGTSSPR